MQAPVFPYRSAVLALLLFAVLAIPAEAILLVDEDFEVSLGDWSQGGGDEFNWARDANGTPSSGTGPAADHTTGSGWYVYAEASHPNYPSKTAILDGPCIDLTGRSAASWSFWYHMTGTAMGTLDAEVSTNCSSPSTWTSVFAASGDQGSSWQQANVNLSAYLGSQVKIRFRVATGSDWSSDIAVDDVLVDVTGGALPPPPALTAQPLVDALDFEKFKTNIDTLSSATGPTGGTRYWNKAGNTSALVWIQAELESYGYTVEHHEYQYGGQTKQNTYATKVGTVYPDQMFIVSGHMDSYNTQSSGSAFAPGANDDASGTSLVLEAARVFGDPSVSTEYSVRFILWNNEETGLNGSGAYVADRASLQGVESPPASGLYPEPTWLLIAQHDMMLWDHGLPSGPNQIPGADVDIEYQVSSAFATESLAFADIFQSANVDYGPAYPAEIGNNMNHTDSKSFWNDCPAISLRENQRVAEIGNGSDPNWHKNSDIMATYSEDDFMLGFTALQTTVGAIGELSGATVAAQVPVSAWPSRGLIVALLVALAVMAITARQRLDPTRGR